MAFFVYVLQNTEGRFYIGQTTDIERRLQRHNMGKVFWTKSRGPWKLFACKQFATRSEAMSCERYLKSLKSHDAVEAYVAQR